MKSWAARRRCTITEPPPKLIVELLPERVAGLLRETGWRGLFSGLMPRLTAAVPRSIFTVLFYEKAISLCKSPEK